ncbi:endonuclease domain-containing protein [Sphingosinithalassobacter portus]|uniref:endonuclease domain-containing protein n=1 Tax=Stakelama portus TaxID=2676234 RepID=UPI001EFD247F|nr:DUF559 domain-containing protein [Sphingosinithalassobacter portus]
MPQIDPLLLDRAKRMRTQPTPFEQKLWGALRGRRFEGVKFSRQVVIGAYIVDFVARSHRLVVEIDGESHGISVGRDAQRSNWLEKQGYRVIRFTNRDVGENLDGVLAAIGEALGAAPHPDPLPDGEREERE